VCQEINDLAGDVADHETRLRSGAEMFSALRGDVRVIKILMVLAVIASFLGGAVGPEIWKAFGVIR
jgi:hypothetical protein